MSVDAPETTANRTVPLDEIEVPAIDEYPATESVLLHGPPGTGKTTTAAARVALLLRDHGYTVGQIAWATYRRDLADDTLERLAEWEVIDTEALDNPRTGNTRNIGTFHALANRAVGGLDDPIESYHPKKFCDDVLEVRYSTSKPWETSPGKELFDFFHWMKNNLYDPGDPDDYHHYPDRDRLEEQYRGDPHEAWNVWEAFKEREEVIDYHEQLEAALDDAAVPSRDVLVIDEYHDATPLIALVVEKWMDAAETVIVAGDPHQVVNAYAGADPYFFQRLEGEYPRILLDKSYRVGRGHWVPATDLLANAHDPPPVEPTGAGEVSEYRSPQFARGERGWTTPPASNEASPQAIVDGAGDASVMFLTRTQIQADAIGAALESDGIIYTSQSDLGGWNTPRGETRLALYNALVKLEGFTPEPFEGGNYGLSRFGDGHGDPADVYLSSAEAVALLEHTNADHLAQSRADTREVCNRLAADEEARALTDFDEYVEPSFWGVYTDGYASERKLNAGRRSDRERTALRTALADQDGLVDPREVNVSVMTIHASKGQEADHVVVYDGITTTIKNGMHDDDDTAANEWRTWYVATTRAADRLHIMRDAFPWMHSILPSDFALTATEAARGGR